MHKEKTRISDRERKCLEQLVEWYGDDERNCVYMKGIAAQTGLDMAQVRRSVRSLARKGLAEYQRGLMNEDGVAGSGYCATEKGAALLNPCDVCGRLAVYDYTVNDDGEQLTIGQMVAKMKGRSVLECEEHYQVSAKSHGK